MLQWACGHGALQVRDRLAGQKQAALHILSAAVYASSPLICASDPLHRTVLLYAFYFVTHSHIVTRLRLVDFSLFAVQLQLLASPV